LDILEHADAPQQCRALEQHADARTEPTKRFVFRLCRIEAFAVDGDRSRCRALESHEMPHEHRLSRLNRAEHQQRFAPCDEDLYLKDDRRTCRTREVVYLEGPLRGRGPG